jgi:hypothetical protein
MIACQPQRCLIAKQMLSVGQISANCSRSVAMIVNVRFR